MNKCVQYVSSELARREVIQPWVAPAAVWQSLLVPCQPCAKRRNGATHRRCRGWRLAFRGDRALSFQPVRTKVGTVRIALEGSFNMQRPEGARGSWENAPMQACTGAIIIRDSTSDTPLTRQHIDLANADQPGTTWHLQLGGVGSSEDGEWRRSVEVARWPSPPIDFMLLVELGIFLFQWDHWNDLRVREPWKRYVRDTEDLVLEHYVDALSTYWDQRSNKSSWLSMQCNQCGELSARLTQ
jgi:hypothetical protein